MITPKHRIERPAEQPWCFWEWSAAVILVALQVAWALAVVAGAVILVRRMM